MYWILCSESDASALWAFQGLQARHVAPLMLITAEVLGGATAWRHRIAADGAATVSIKLAEGRTLETASCRGVLNRLVVPAIPHLAGVVVNDQAYIQQEVTAFYLSWLESFPCPVLNTPSPQGLCGAWRHEAEWVCLARAAGLPTQEYGQDSRTIFSPSAFSAPSFVPVQTPVIVVGTHIFGAPVSPEIASGCIQLARAAGTDILGVSFITGDTPQRTWYFAGATPLPDLRVGGSDLLDVLAVLLTEKRGGVL